MVWSLLDWVRSGNTSFFELPLQLIGLKDDLDDCYTESRSIIIADLSFSIYGLPWLITYFFRNPDL